MDIRGTLESLALSFSERMTAFEGRLNETVAPQQLSLSSLAADFEAFRKFVMDTLKNLERQVTTLAIESDDMEMRSRRNMLLLHGVPDVKDEDSSRVFLSLASQHLRAKQLSLADLGRVIRLGRMRDNKPRPLLVKFQSEVVRDELWMSKTHLKGTGITMSEFLTKHRHTIFMAARERLGVSKCWTSAGRIIAIGSSGKRYRISSLADVEKLDAPVPTVPATSSNKEMPPSSTSGVRGKRAASLLSLSSSIT